MDPPNAGLSLLGLIASFVLVAWRMRTRIRRLTGRQHFSPARAWVSIALFAIVVVALLAGSLDHPAQSGAELLGVGIGAGLAVYGLRATRFEVTPDGMYYVPNAHIGVALSSLLALRVAYRLFESYFATAGFTEPPASFVRSPLTLLIVGTLAGYYAWYALGLLRWHRAHSGRDGSSGSGA